MHFVVLFDDDPKSDPEIRARHMPAHLAFLQAHATLIKAAGPLRSGEDPAGGLWLVTANTPQEVEGLIRADPFWPTGLRRGWRILEWVRVFENGSALINLR